jgi:hypothetical protein
MKDLSQRLDQLDETVKTLKETIRKFRNARLPAQRGFFIPSSEQRPRVDSRREQTTDEYFQRGEDFGDRAPVGPVPMTGDGRVVDKAWVQQGDEMVRYGSDGKVAQRVKVTDTAIKHRTKHHD